MPLSLNMSLHPKHILEPNVNVLDAKGDETPQAKPRLKLVKWVGFAPGVRCEENRIDVSEI
jgi:hypothetical protein